MTFHSRKYPSPPLIPSKSRFIKNHDSNRTYEFEKIESMSEIPQNPTLTNPAPVQSLSSNEWKTEPRNSASVVNLSLNNENLDLISEPTNKKITSVVTNLDADESRPEVISPKSIVKYLNEHRENLMTFAVQEDNTKDGRPYADVTVNRNIVRGLLDSGSIVTLAGKKCVDFFKECEILTLHEPVFVKSASDVLHSCCQVAKVPYQFRDKTITVPTLLIPDLPRGLILGVDFWKSFNLAPELFDTFFVDVVDKNLLTSDADIPKSKSVAHDLSEIMIEELEQVKAMFLASTEDFIGCTNLVEHVIETPTIPLTDGVRQKPYTFSTHDQPAVDKEIERMIGLGIISRISSSSWCSPLVKVQKPNGAIRICIDARKLNEVTKKNSYPLPHMQRIFQNMQPGKYYAKIDLSSAFWQVPLSESSKPKTAFGVIGRGLFQYEKMPFGVYGAPSTLASLMDKVLGHDLEPYVFYYLDDIIVIGKNWTHYLQLLRIVAERLKKANLSINLEKSEFALKQVEYCGFIVDENGRRPDLKKVEPIVKFPKPNSKQQLKRFLGMANHLSSHVPENYASIVAPLNDLLKGKYVKSSTLKWTEEANLAFVEIKAKIAKPVLLAQPDFTKPFHVQTDGSLKAAGAFIFRYDGKKKRVIEFMSKRFNKDQEKYGACERELLSLLLGVEKFRPYIEGSHFKVIIDNSAIQYLHRIKNPSGRLTRWAMRLLEFDFETTHCPGSENKISDALSRAIDEVVVVGDSEYEELKKKIMNDPNFNPNLKIDNDVLYKACKIVDITTGLKRVQWKVFVPLNRRLELIRKYHDELTHQGATKTMKRLQQFYTWPRMGVEVKEYVKKCDVCKRAKAPNKNLMPPAGKMKNASRPFELYMVDFKGPMPRSKNGNAYLLVVTDFFSKFSILRPMRDMSAEKVVQFMEDEIFLKFGIPRVCLSDNGPCFRSATWRKLLEKYDINPNLIANYSPQVNNVERVNRVIGDSLRAMISIDHREWDRLCPKIAWAMNTAFHESTKLTPFEIAFGQPGFMSGKEHDIHDQTERETDLTRRMKDLNDIRQITQANLKLNYERYRKGYNLRKVQRTFQPQQVVYRRNFGQSDKAKNVTAKFLDKFVKCKVVKHCGPNAVLLADMTGKEVGTFHLKDVFSA